jgi:hypothetical protein
MGMGIWGSSWDKTRVSKDRTRIESEHLRVGSSLECSRIWVGSSLDRLGSRLQRILPSVMFSNNVFFFFYKNKTVIWLDFFIFSNAHNCNWIFELVRSLFMLSKVAGYCHILQLGHHAFVSKEELTSKVFTLCKLWTLPTGGPWE